MNQKLFDELKRIKERYEFLAADISNSRVRKRQLAIINRLPVLSRASTDWLIDDALDFAWKDYREQLSDD